jgi:NTE family protein
MTEPRGPDIFDINETRPSTGAGLCLSGGGYRAMLFHLGALRRLNEAGWLVKLTRVASVSGGSITAGVLGLAWKELAFNANGVAARFADLVERPILLLANSTVDIPAVLTGLWPGRIAERVAKAYDRALFHGATLQDLPSDLDGPRFIVLATDLSNATLWRFSKPYMRTWRSEPIWNPTLGLAKAVASSSAFPPVLSPSLLKVDGRAVHLTDGGVYDNLGLEPVVKRCATVLVSDGGGTFGEAERPARDWLRGTYRILQSVDVEVRRLRRRHIVGLLATKQRSGAFWAINSDRADFPAPQGALPCPIEKTRALAHLSTRLAALDEPTRQRLVNWGYAAADAGLRSYVDLTLGEPAQFPYPTVGVG